MVLSPSVSLRCFALLLAFGACGNAQISSDTFSSTSTSTLSNSEITTSTSTTPEISGIVSQLSTFLFGASSASIIQPSTPSEGHSATSIGTASAGSTPEGHLPGGQVASPTESLRWESRATGSLEMASSLIGVNDGVPTTLVSVTMSTGSSIIPGVGSSTTLVSVTMSTGSSIIPGVGSSTTTGGTESLQSPSVVGIGAPTSLEIPTNGNSLTSTGSMQSSSNGNGANTASQTIQTTNISEVAFSASQLTSPILTESGTQSPFASTTGIPTTPIESPPVQSLRTPVASVLVTNGQTWTFEATKVESLASKPETFVTSTTDTAGGVFGLIIFPNTGGGGWRFPCVINCANAPIPGGAPPGTSLPNGGGGSGDNSDTDGGNGPREDDKEGGRPEKDGDDNGDGNNSSEGGGSSTPRGGGIVGGGSVGGGGGGGGGGGPPIGGGNGNSPAGGGGGGAGGGAEGNNDDNNDENEEEDESTSEEQSTSTSSSSSECTTRTASDCTSVCTLLPGSTVPSCTPRCVTRTACGASNSATTTTESCSSKPCRTLYMTTIDGGMESAVDCPDCKSTPLPPGAPTNNPSQTGTYITKYTITLVKAGIVNTDPGTLDSAKAYSQMSSIQIAEKARRSGRMTRKSSATVSNSTLSSVTFSDSAVSSFGPSDLAKSPDLVISSGPLSNTTESSVMSSSSAVPSVGPSDLAKYPVSTELS